MQNLVVDGVEQSLQLITSALAGEKDSRSQRAANMIALNAGAALYVAGVATSIADGVDTANGILASGAGLEKLQQLAAMTRSF
jgi:anthranilate phosphoribosyltransferase